jgi:acyl-coenzyme A thioesterase PaaI-like protein
MNIWPPFVGAGIHVTAMAEDYREVIVELRPHWYNRNYFGDHFGGSLYAMTDPFYALMLIHVLGPGYRVKHAAGRIRYLAPARGVVRAHFRLSDEHVARILAAAESGEKHLPQYTLEIVDREGEVIARATQTAYVRKRPPH